MFRAFKKGSVSLASALNLRSVLTIRPIGLALAGLLHRLAGADSDIEKCPARERHYAQGLGLLVLFVWAMQLLLIPFSLSVVFGQSMPIWVCAAAGFIAASLIVGFDMLMIRAGWYRQGLRSLKQAGLVESRSNVEAVLVGMAIAVRLGLNVAAASLIALFALLYVFGDDVRKEIVRSFQAINAPLYLEAARRHDERVAGVDALIEREVSLLKTLAMEEATLQQRLYDPLLGDAEVMRLSNEIQRLEGEKASVDAEGSGYERVQINEEFGHRITTETGLAGRGYAWRAAAAHRNRVNQASARLAERIAAQQKRLDAVRADRAASSDRMRSTAATRIGEIAEQRQIVQQRHDSSVAERNALLTNREASIDRAARSQQGAFREPSYGPLEQFNALVRLLHDPGPFAVWLVLKLFIMALELSAVVASMTIFVPTSYAKELVTKDYEDSIRALRRMEASHRSPSLDAADHSVGAEEPPKGDVHNLYDLVKDAAETQTTKEAA